MDKRLFPKAGKEGHEVTDKKHIHKLKRVKYKSGSITLFCALPDCAFKVNPALALGKRSICWRCGESFILNEYSLRLAKPHCEGCHKSKKETKWVHTPTEPEREATNELVHTLSLAERLKQTVDIAKGENLEEDEGDI